MPTDPTEETRQHASEPAEPFGTMRVSRGTVKWWNAAKGYGAISVAELAPWDIWCGFSAIVGVQGFRALSQGESVEVEYFRFNQESFKYVARSVRRL